MNKFTTFLICFAIVILGIVIIVFMPNNHYSNDKNCDSGNIITPIIIFTNHQNDLKAYTEAQDNYNDARYKQDFDLIISTLQKYIECANKLNRYGTMAWQYNNMANYYISEFMNRTDYETKMDLIYKCKNNDVKAGYISSVKIIFISEYDLLNKASDAIQQAQILNNKYPDDDRTKKIESNLKFISYINKLIERGNK